MSETASPARGGKLVGMSRKPYLWLVCISLVLTRLLGVHVHSCAGLEGTPHQHESAHYADNGLLFGEHHVGDHADNHESELTALVSSAKAKLAFGDGSALPAPDRLVVAAARGSMVGAARGPPVLDADRPRYRQPPLRGPPAYS